MKISSISLAETGYYSKLMVDYANNKNELKPFFNKKLSLNNIDELIAERNNFPFPAREILAETLLKQYESLDISDKTKENINKLSLPNTYTITTGHQVNLMTGPVYFIYKIATCIKLCQQLNEKYKQYNFLPIYWMNSEDHDIAEINHFNLFGNKIEWDLDWKGASGKMPTESLKDKVFPEIEQILGDSEKAQHIIEVLKECYLEEANLEKATFKFVNYLFRDFGLVILNQNDKKFKQSVDFLIEKELLSNDNENLVNTLSDDLIKTGYHAQVKPRATNLFYFKNNKRERIEKTESENYVLVDSEEDISKSEMFDLLKNKPENFSFNVVTRTLYQQMLLPNLAYIGGGGELAYWLQYKTMFEANKVFFPSLILRNTLVWINKSQQKKLNKVGLSIDDFFQDIEKLKKKIVKSESELSLNLDEEKNKFNQILNSVKAKAIEIDGSLSQMIDAELSKLLSQLEKLETKMIRAEKRKFDQILSQIDSIYSTLFPNNSLQERQDNFIEIWFQYGIQFIAELIELIEPNQEEFNLVFE